MADSASPSPSSHSYYGSPCPCCGNKKRRRLSSSSPSPASSSPPDATTYNKTTKHRPPISPTSVTSSKSPSFSFPTISDYSPAPFMSLPPSIKNKFSFPSHFSSTTSSSSSPLSLSSLFLSPSAPTPVDLLPSFGSVVACTENKMKTEAVNPPPTWKKIEKLAVISPQENLSEVVTVPQVVNKEPDAMTSPKRNKSDAVKIAQEEKKEQDAVISPQEEKPEEMMKLGDKAEEAVILQEEKKALEEVIAPEEKKAVTAPQLNYDGCDKGLTPKRAVMGKNAVQEIRVGFKCKCGMFREIILT